MTRSNSSASATPLSSSSDDSRTKLSIALVRQLSTRWHLPPGWEAYFSVRGNGMTIECPICDWKPGREVDPWQRWKVTTTHIVTAHAPGLKSRKPARLLRIK